MIGLAAMSIEAVSHLAAPDHNGMRAYLNNMPGYAPEDVRRRERQRQYKLNNPEVPIANYQPEAECTCHLDICWACR